MKLLYEHNKETHWYRKKCKFCHKMRRGWKYERDKCICDYHSEDELDNIFPDQKKNQKQEL